MFPLAHFAFSLCSHRPPQSNDEDTSLWSPCPICATIEGTLDRLICDGCETEYVCVYISNAETLERGEHIVVHKVSLICLDQGVWVRRRH